ncbi:hypothetical protein C8Q75DRAFT_730148 [Abortiporus biennis]|nr:hypothetical protein C8Q75DRAFT_730148 [Abortiporus biennis]
MRLFGGFQNAKTLKSEKSSSLQPFQLTINFEGELPPGIPHRSIPLNIAISLPPEFGNFICPVILPTPLAPFHPLSTVEFLEEREVTNSEDQDYIQFLPLPSSFQISSRDSWLYLVSDISNWLNTVIDNTTAPEWKWGLEAYWMAFIAAYPKYPEGRWDCWDARIGPESKFVDEWANSEDYPDHGAAAFCPEEDNKPCLVCVSVRVKIWIKFKQFMSLYYPHPIIQPS